MTIDKIENWRRFESLGTSFVEAFSFLDHFSRDNTPAEVGRHTVGRDGVVATLSDVVARDCGHAIFEWHQRFADIHFCISGEERFGWKPSADGLQPRTPFNVDKDVGTFNGSADFILPLQPGYFALVLPGELHAPALGTGNLRKWVVKVPVIEGRDN